MRSFGLDIPRLTLTWEIQSGMKLDPHQEQQKGTEMTLVRNVRGLRGSGNDIRLT